MIGAGNGWTFLTALAFWLLTFVVCGAAGEWLLRRALRRGIGGK